MYMYMIMYVYVHVCMYVCLSLSLYIYIYVYMYTCIIRSCYVISVIVGHLPPDRLRGAPASDPHLGVQGCGV